jgi:hypothetical protein
MIARAGSLGVGKPIVGAWFALPERANDRRALLRYFDSARRRSEISYPLRVS